MTSISQVPVLVLAGGRGTRLRTVVADRPKVMADVNGRPFLDFILDHLQGQGVQRVTLLTGYQAEMIERHYGARYRAMALAYSRESSPLGTGGAVRRALLDVECSADACLVINGDTFFPADLQRALSLSRRGEDTASNLILTTRVADLSRYGSLELAPGSDRVLRFLEKGQKGGGLINAGSYCLQAAPLREMSLDTFALETDWLVPLAEAGRLVALEDPAAFIDIGIPSDYAAFQALQRS